MNERQLQPIGTYETVTYVGELPDGREVARAAVVIGGLEWPWAHRDVLVVNDDRDGAMALAEHVLARALRRRILGHGDPKSATVRDSGGAA